MPFSRMQPSPPRSSSGTSWGTRSSMASSPDEDMESQSSETLSSTDDDDHHEYGRRRGGGKRDDADVCMRHDDDDEGSTAAMRRGTRRKQRRQPRPGCCQTALLLAPALLAKATSCIAETCGRWCCAGTRRNVLGHRSRTRGKPAREYKSVIPGWDSDTSSRDGPGSASKRYKQDVQTRQQPQTLRHQARSERQARRQQRPPQNDDGESTLSDSSEDSFASPRASDPVAPPASSRRPITQTDRHKLSNAGHNIKKKPAALRLRPARVAGPARVAQSSSESESDTEDVAVSPVRLRRQQHQQPRQRQNFDGESTSSGSSSDDNFLSPRDRDPEEDPGSSPRSITQSRPNRTAAEAARRPTVASTVDQAAMQSDPTRAVKRKSATLQLRPVRQRSAQSGGDSDSDSDMECAVVSRERQYDDTVTAKAQSTSPLAASVPSFAIGSTRGSGGSAGAAMERVRQHSDLRASVDSDASQPHIEEWVAHPDGSTKSSKGVSVQRGLGGQELIHQLAATLRQRKSSKEPANFIDPDFPPQNSSLYRDHQKAGASTREGAPLGSIFFASVSQSEAHGGDAAQKPVVWCRAAEIGLKAELQLRAGSSARCFPILQIWRVARTSAQPIAPLFVDFLADDAGTCVNSCVVTSRGGDNVVGSDSIRQRVKDGTLNDDTLVFFPYKTEQGRRHLGWHGTHRRWAECRHEFAGGELSQERRSSTDQSTQLKVWHEGDVQPSDIKQGLLGDCYLMAACASIALLPPEYLVRDLIIDESDVGLFGVKFYFAGRWMSVAIDDWFPCIISGGVLRPCFAQPSSDGALWTCIIEKAFAKLMGSFEAIIGGEAVDAQNYLCAGDIETRELNGGASLEDCVTTEDISASSSTQRQREKLSQQGVKQDEAERIWLELCDRVPLPRDRSASSIAIGGGQRADAAAFFSCAVASSKTSAAATSGLNAQHQYSILGAIELVSSGERIIELRDPHGKCEWNGVFCPSDTRSWTSAVKREVFGSSKLNVPQSGCAFMRWADFRSFFDEIGICLAFPQAQGQGVVRRESVLGRFDAHSSGGKHGLATFKFNPAFSLRMLARKRSSRGKRHVVSDERVRVKVTLSQPDTRPITRSDAAGGGAYDLLPAWEDMYLYCLTASTYRKLTAPRTVASGTESSKQSIRAGTSRLGGMLLSRQQTQPVESSDPYLPDWVREISPALRLRRRLGQAELDLDPQEHYVLVACPWGPGVSDATGAERSTTNGRTSIAGVGNSWDFCITLHASTEVQLSPLDSDKSAELLGQSRWSQPTTEQRRLMQSLRPRQACCFICDRGFGHGEAHYEVPEGQTHLQCYEDYRKKTARRCLECGGAVLGRYHQLEEDDPNATALRAKLNAAHGFDATIDWKHPLVLHSENGCYDRYRERTAPRCAVCGGSVLSKYYEVDKDGGGAKLIIHAEGDCYQQYQEATAERCLVCKLPVLGSYYDVQKDSEQGKVHADGPCHKRWLESAAPHCAECSEPIVGSSYQVGAHGARVQVHADGHCLARWKARQETSRHTHNGAASDDDY